MGMSENKDSDFWNHSNDDFWNKPVVSDDWLADDNTGIWNTETEIKQEQENTDSFWNTDMTEKQTDYSGVSKEFLGDKKQEKLWTSSQEKPQTQTEQHREEQSVKMPVNNSWYENPYVQNPYTAASPVQQTVKINRQAKENGAAGQKEKSIHIHTIICLAFLFLAVVSVIISVLASKAVINREVKRAKNIAYTTEKIEGRFALNENNSILLDEEAYTIVSPESFQGFPKGLKLIAVFADVESDEYIPDSRGMRDIYIGYMQNGKETYKKPSGSDLVKPYIAGYRFSDEQLLSIYGVGNGFDSAGYYFFFVPSDVEEITLYMEKRKMEGKVSVLEKVYEKNMKVLPEDAKLTEELADREVG